MLTALRARTDALRAGADDGFTLVELLVAMGLMTLVGALSLTYFVGSHTAADRTTGDGLALARARTAMSTVMRELQLADSPGTAGAATGRFDTLTATQAVFYANDVPTSRSGSAPRTAPTKIALTVDATAKTLSMVRYAPVTTNGVTTWPTASAPQVLVGELSNTAAVFSCTADGVTCLPATSTTPVVSVTVTLTVARSGSPSQTLTSTAAMNGVV